MRPLVRFVILVAGTGLALASTAAAAAPVRLVTGNDDRPFADRDLPDGGMATAVVRARYAGTGRKGRIRFNAPSRASGCKVKIARIVDGVDTRIKAP